MAIEYSGKTWQDYPSETTPITAAELNRMEQGIKSACDGVDDVPEQILSKLESFIKSMYPDYTRTVLTETVDANSTLYPGEDDPYFNISSALFDPEKDGLIIYKSGGIWIDKNVYEFDTSTANVVRVEFSVNVFSEGDEMIFQIYKKPSVPTIWTGTQAQYNAIAAPDADTIYIITG